MAVSGLILCGSQAGLRKRNTSEMRDIIPTLNPGEVHIWTARADPMAAPSVDFEVMLSQAERDAANRFRFKKHSLMYVFAHGVLRDILSAYLRTGAAGIRFSRGAFGKPFLVDNGMRAPTSFNMSHSGNTVLIALAPGQCIGVDVEMIRPLADFGLIAKSHFTPGERGILFRHAPEDQVREFFRCWTRKEAFIKAVGKGLSIPLNSFDTSIPAGERGRRLARTPDAPEIDSWWLADLELPCGYVGAVVVEKGCDRLVYSEWRPRGRG